MGEEELVERPKDAPLPPTAPARAELRKDAIVVPEEGDASTLRNKGAYGATVDGLLHLTLLEACYLVEANRLLVRRRGEPLDFADLVRHANRERGDFEIAYVVYRDLRQRGYVVEEGQPPIDFRIHPRGGRPGKTATKVWVSAVNERAPFRFDILLEHLRHVQGLRRQFLVGVVDEESDLTYYAAREVQPRGTVSPREVKVEAHLLADRAMVLDAAEASRLFDAGYFGKFLGRRLQLSLLETAYLKERGRLAVVDKLGKAVGLEELARRARRVQPDFDPRLRVYADLRERGVVVKTGYKYGTHFRAYEGDPERVHAKYLVHALPADHRGGWPEVSRAVRLAHGVKKHLLFASCGEEIAYVHLERVRP